MLKSSELKEFLKAKGVDLMYQGDETAPVSEKVIEQFYQLGLIDLNDKKHLLDKINSGTSQAQEQAQTQEAEKTATDSENKTDKKHKSLLDIELESANYFFEKIVKPLIDSEKTKPNSEMDADKNFTMTGKGKGLFGINPLDILKILPKDKEKFNDILAELQKSDEVKSLKDAFEKIVNSDFGKKVEDNISQIKTDTITKASDVIEKVRSSTVNDNFKKYKEDEEIYLKIEKQILPLFEELDMWKLEQNGVGVKLIYRNILFIDFTLENKDLCKVKDVIYIKSPTMTLSLNYKDSPIALSGLHNAVLHLYKKLKTDNVEAKAKDFLSGLGLDLN